MCVNYLITFFFGPASPYGTVIVFGIMMVLCTVSAGIAYLVGYKNIPLIEPFLQKIKKNINISYCIILKIYRKIIF